MTFYSKKSWGIGALLFIPVAGAFFGAWVEKGFLPALLPLGILILVSWLWFGTRYILRDGKLITWAGFIPFPQIKVADIIKIKPTKSFISAPACSLDRILVQYSSSDYLIISPKNKKEFIQALLAENPEIVLDERLNPTA